MDRGHRNWPAALALGASILGCVRQSAEPPSPIPTAAGIPSHNLDVCAVEDYDDEVDYFPDKASFRHATQLSVEYLRHYKIARIETRGMGEEFEFVLVQRGTPLPVTRRDAMVLWVPLTRFSLGTYRYGRATELLGVIDRLVGFGNHTHASVPAILEMFESGKLEKNMNLEAIAERGTEAHFEWYFPASLSRSATYRRLGIPGVPMAEHLEPTPLARAEWVKFFALFFNKERVANAAFDRIEEAYRGALRELSDVASKPNVLAGGPEKGGWSQYGGQNLGARMIEDAGGNYLGADNPSGEPGARVPFEAALLNARRADVWIVGPGFSFGNVEGRTIDDPRFGFVPAVQAGRVFVGHAGYPDGINPWWDHALVEPHLELLDLMTILHPGQHENHELRFYRRLESRTR